jgi:hypothetical protein
MKSQRLLVGDKPMGQSEGAAFEVNQTGFVHYRRIFNFQTLGNQDFMIRIHAHQPPIKGAVMEAA